MSKYSFKLQIENLLPRITTTTTLQVWVEICVVNWALDLVLRSGEREGGRERERERERERWGRERV